jgi:Trypsin-like peptidase domain
VPMRERVVEVEADLGNGATPRWRYGSGVLLGGRTVLTAAHVVVDAVAANIRGTDKILRPATVDPAWIGDRDRFDLALLELQDDSTARLSTLPLATIDRDTPTGRFVDGCWSVGYPAFQEVERDAEGRSVRETAQVGGHIPPLGGLVGGKLTFEVTATPRELPAGGTLEETPWSGMSGAAVFAGDAIVGVVAEHAPKQGSSAIVVTPIQLLGDPDHAPENASAWWERLGVSDPSHLRSLPTKLSQAAPTVTQQMLLGSQAAVTATWVQRASGRALLVDTSGRLLEWPEPAGGHNWPPLPRAMFLSSDATGEVLLAGNPHGVWVMGTDGSSICLWSGSERQTCHAASICECSRHVALGISEISRTNRTTSRFEIVELPGAERWRVDIPAPWLHPDLPTAVAFSRDCRLVALSSTRGLEVVELASMSATGFEVQTGNPSQIAFDRTQTLLARGTYNGWIEVWDLPSVAVIYREKWHAAVLSVDVDSARRAVAFGTEHGAHIAALDTKVVVNPVDLARCRSIAVGDDGVLTVIGGRPDAEYAPTARRVKTWNLPGNALIGPVMIGTIELATEALY